MSVNVKTATGLKKISGENITSAKVLAAIGYTPAQAKDLEAHKDNTTVHINENERAKWNAKSDFSGYYEDLKDAPNILEDDSNTLYIADASGNIIAKIGEDGVYTTDVILTKNEKSVLQAIEYLEDNVFSGDYNDLENKPNILEDNSQEFIIVDKDGYIVFRVDNEGIHVHEATIGGHKVGASLTRLNTAEKRLDNHIIDEIRHITQEEREKWNDPNIYDETNDMFQIVDDEGRIALQVDGEATKIDVLRANEINIGEMNISTKIEDFSSELNTHISNTEVHLQENERNNWDTALLKAQDLEILTSNIRKQSNEEDDAFYIVDSNDNIAFQVDEESIKVNNLNAKKINAENEIISPIFKGNLNGNANSATVLENAKTIQTNLASTSAALFNGSANIVPGVTGILPIANGGTGAITAANALINLGALALTGGTVTGPTAFGSTLTVNGVATFSNTTASSSTTTGAVKISGGLGVGGNVYADKVYNAVWNDYAELFPRGEETEPGDIIALDETAEEEKYIKAIKGYKALVGVHSDEYGHLIGGENCSIEENLQKYIPVGLAGRVWVKVHDEPSLGDYITASEIPGVGEKTNNRNQAIGIVVSKKQNGKVKIKII